jgi:hypothetical protein
VVRSEILDLVYAGSIPASSTSHNKIEGKVNVKIKECWGIGGIGIRDGLKIRFSKEIEGSTPSSPTIPVSSMLA